MSKFEKTNFLNNFGSITAFGSPLWKPGLDVDLKKGDNVNSPKSGRIAFAGENAGFGNQVKVVDKRGNEIWLSHLDKINVKAGDNIQAGQKIGLGGNTGKTIPGVGGDGSHLDITVKKGKNFLTAQQAKKYVDFEPVSSFIDNKNLNQQIDQARKLGKTDTEI